MHDEEIGEIKEFSGVPPVLRGRTNRNVMEVLWWVFENMGREKPDLSGCPSEGAWHYLRQCQTDEKVKTAFYSTQFQKLLPNKTLMEELVRKQSEGEVDDGVEDLERCLRKAHAESAVRGKRSKVK